MVALVSFRRAEMIMQARAAYFPLTRDHDLLYVLEFNVSRAILTNYDLICTASAWFTNSFTGCGTEPAIPLSALATIDFVPLPKALEPTALQLAIPHESWVDIFPSPRFRDNLISAVANGQMDSDELVEDLVGNLFDWMGCTIDPKSEIELKLDTIDPTLLSHDSPGSNSTLSGTKKSDELGIIAWADPWDITGWEMKPEFASKWSFLLKGCQEMLDASNHWRLARGEEALVVEI
jgi:hypothetical protein